MNKNSRILIYVSGPPCSGKSTLCNALLNRKSSFQYVIGDEFWIQNGHYDFTKRIKITSHDIVSALENTHSNLVLLEWIPSYGPFVENIKKISEMMAYEFIHIVITAPKAELEKRKLRRDGDTDLGPVNLERYKTLENITLFDTSVRTIDSIVNECIKILK